MTSRLRITEKVREAEKSPPGVEDIMSAASWDARLAKARELRKQFLANAQSNQKNSVGEISADDLRFDQINIFSGAVDESFPSISDVLATPNRNDQIARATACREQVLAQRQQDAAISNTGRSFDAEPFKNVVRGAFNDSSHTKNQRTSVLVLTRDMLRALPVHHRNISAGALVLIVFGLVLSSPTSNQITSDLVGAGNNISIAHLAAR